ncbi:MAG TPA: hypothetical protein VFB29_05670 [Pseudolabrys sp.]|nr:hypothetical protein [Pseudolabrys sp.]
MKVFASLGFALTLLSSAPPALAGEYEYDFFGLYLQRRDGVTPDAGNAKAVNTVTHFIDPWRPYVRNRRIPANGERMVGAVERYRDVRKSSGAAPTLSHPTTPQGGSSGGAGAAAPALTGQ